MVRAYWREGIPVIEKGYLNFLAQAKRANVDPATGKRRATMTSKELDDEEKQMRIVIEESKREVAGTTGTGRRNGKRARHDSSEE